MKLPVISRRRHELEVEKLRRALSDARAQLLELRLVAKPGRRRWPSLLAGAWLLVIGVILGGTAVPHAQNRPQINDAPACIGKARYQHPVHGNQYQELVNALYACGIYG